MIIKPGEAALQFAEEAPTSNELSTPMLGATLLRLYHYLDDDGYDHDCAGDGYDHDDYDHDDGGDSVGVDIDDDVN